MKTALRFADLPDTYEKLVGILPPRPIHTAEQYEETREMVETLAGHQLSADQDDYLEALGTFMLVYEDEHHPLRDVSGLALLRRLVEDHGMTASELGRLLGDASIGEPVLAGDYRLTTDHVKLLGERFALSPAAFLD